MKRLWTSWRMEYIGDKHRGERKNSGIFCRAAGQPENDLTTKVIAR